jgi:cell wall-associated NlpC family hydrolase
MSTMAPAVADPAPGAAPAPTAMIAKQTQVALHAAQAREALAIAPAVEVAADAVIEVERKTAEGVAAVDVTPAPLPPPPPTPRATPVASRTADRAAVGNPAPGGTWEAAASIALRYLGVPYVFGGQTPAGFDCSGLVVHVFRQLGVELPHQSTRIRDSARTVRIARADARAGDIIWTPGHVAIYLGNGQLVEAVSPGRPLRTHRVWQSNPMFLRVV